MTTEVLDTNAKSHEHDHEQEHDKSSIRVFGFWVYLMSDCLLFAALFATFAVLKNNLADGPSAKDIFELKGVLIETFCLLFSSIFYGFVMLAMNDGKKRLLLFWLVITFAFGAAFVVLELREFSHMLGEGYSWRVSAFLSSYFTLVGTHGLHVSCGLIWMLVMMVQVYHFGLEEPVKARLMCLSLFWHFLDLIWILVFTFVYLLGVLNG